MVKTTSERNKTYYEKNKERLRVARKARYADNKENERETARKRYYKKQNRDVPPPPLPKKCCESCGQKIKSSESDS